MRNFVQMKAGPSLLELCRMQPKFINEVYKMKNGVFLSRTESAALRGIAILGIILHNYCHFLGFAVKENEYKFDSSRPMQFFDKLFSLDSDLFIHIFSFLGHYGVPIFLFISGYGLVKKYEAHPQTDNENPSLREGHRVGSITLVEGNRENIKITTPFDLLVAEAIVKLES